MVRLPMPPSANVMWRSDFVRKRVIVSRAGRIFRDECAPILAKYRQPIEGALSVTACFYFKSAKVRVDLDNRIKPLLDVCQVTQYGCGLYLDDSQITAIHAYKFFDKENPRVEVTVEAL
tara:strand:- start:1766 stop:2122 length:357 start_codon:yes stop_codon:yes gene_type:complete